MFNKLAALVAAALLCVSLAAPAEGALITFNSRAMFNAAAPGLPLETFEAGLVGPGGVVGCAAPISGAAASACFPLGGLLAGAIYDSPMFHELVVLGAGFGPVGNASKVLGPNAFADTFNVLYSNANAVGFDVFPGLVAGNVTIEVFSTLNVLLGSFMIPAPLGPTFWGVISDSDLIGRINIASITAAGAAGGELIDNHAFGIAQVPEPVALTLLGSGLLAFGLSRRRAKKAS
jgi:hypothetical protein